MMQQRTKKNQLRKTDKIDRERRARTWWMMRAREQRVQDLAESAFQRDGGEPQFEKRFVRAGRPDRSSASHSTLRDGRRRPRKYFLLRNQDVTRRERATKRQQGGRSPVGTTSRLEDRRRDRWISRRAVRVVAESSRSSRNAASWGVVEQERPGDAASKAGRRRDSQHGRELSPAVRHRLAVWATRCMNRRLRVISPTTWRCDETSFSVRPSALRGTTLLRRPSSSSQLVPRSARAHRVASACSVAHDSASTADAAVR